MPLRATYQLNINASRMTRNHVDLNIPFALLRAAESTGLESGHYIRSDTYRCSPSAWPLPTRQVQKPKYRLSCKNQSSPPGWFHPGLQGPCSAWCLHVGCSPRPADWCSGNAWLPGLKGRRQQCPSAHVLSQRELLAKFQPVPILAEKMVNWFRDFLPSCLIDNFAVVIEEQL